MGASEVAEKAIYGRIAILRMFCPDCEHDALVFDDKYGCCGAEALKPTRIRPHRHAEGRARRKRLSRLLRLRILAKQNNSCIYCGCDLDGYAIRAKNGRLTKLKTEIDHFVSWNYSRDDEPQNLVASCHICNGIKTDKYYESLDRAREAILAVRNKRWVNPS